MPLQPVSFNSSEDVYKFLEKLRARGLIAYDDNSLSIERGSRLASQLIIADDEQTYFLPDILDLPDNEKILSKVTFTKRNNSSGEVLTLFPNALKLSLENDAYLHNHALAAALLNLNPQTNKLLNNRSLHCHDPVPEPIIPFIDTQTERTQECSDVINEILANDNVYAQAKVWDKFSELREGYLLRKKDILSHKYKVFERHFLNHALLALQSVCHKQMQDYLCQLAKSQTETKTEIVELLEKNNHQLFSDASTLTASLYNFITSYSAKISGEFAENHNIADELEQRGCALAANIGVRIIHLWSKYNNNENIMVAGGVMSFFVPPLGVPLLVYGLVKESKRSKKVKAIEGEIDAAQQDLADRFVTDQAKRIHKHIVLPSLKLLEPIASSKTPLQQNMLLRSAPPVNPVDSSLELAPTMTQGLR